MPQRNSRAALPFYAYSSFNKKGGKTVDLVARRRNKALDMYQEMGTYEAIAECLDISPTTVVQYVKRARQKGDVRVQRPFKHRGRQLALQRRKAISDLKAVGLSSREIAKRLNINVRLVQIRLREGR
ncbi:helix-turn-helix domain-containing protein [Mesorhizobium sp. CO1-1-9]|uniref:helix-turn-helix domain-containing protein n=1 Tax=Mesorhizobium sp. CO1-1-9 TaxID=2876630 RepID=UPI001CCF63D2|nr:helix-turn-helix domain-containing protein [Mesorhizobium sp. CO1-1-9]MBZ9693917.1 helix-turn-helix domain-containing protein [Mesorhizobium sp. CO1-1-9]